MSTEENKAIVRRFFMEGPSRGDLGAADDLLASNFTLHVPLPSPSGIAGMNDVITACRAAFEHLNVTGIEIFRIEEGKIAELWGEANLLGLMSQLGILPPLGEGQG